MVLGLEIREECCKGWRGRSGGDLDESAVLGMVEVRLLRQEDLLVDTRIGPGFSGNSIDSSRVLSCIRTCVVLLALEAGAVIVVVAIAENVLRWRFRDVSSLFDIFETFLVAMTCVSDIPPCQYVNVISIA